MKSVSKTVLCVLASSAALLSGCHKKPVRPDPASTLGPQPGGNGALNVSPVATTADANSGLTENKDALTAGNQDRNALQAVYFEYDHSNIRAAEGAKLTAAKEYLDKNPTTRVLLEGHCDWRGTSEYNLGLGDRRAGEAKKYLVKLGVPETKIDTVSKGSEEAAKNADEATMSKDRRVDIVVLKG